MVKGSKSFSLSNAVKRQIIVLDKLENIFKQIIDALQFIHGGSSVHNNIGEKNILMHKISQKWKPVIIHFGK